MDYWDFTHDARLRLTEKEVDRMVSGLSQEAGEHVKLDWWNRRARVCQRQQIADSALFFSRITNGDETLVRECLEHTYSPRQLESIQ